MIALVTKQREDGTWPEAGGSHRRFTGEYKTELGLLKYAFAPNDVGEFRLEIFADKDHIYGEPVKTRWIIR